MQKLKDFFRFAFVALVIGLAVSYVFAGGFPPPGPGIIPSGNNASSTINVSNDNQVKGDGTAETGGLAILGTLTGLNIFATGQLGVGPDPVPDTLDPATFGWTIYPLAALDVNGPIRIRGGNPGLDNMGNPKVLKSSNIYGLADWETNNVGATKIKEGFGIDVSDIEDDSTPTEITNSGFISVALGQTHTTGPNSPTTIQLRTDNPCATPNNAHTSIGACLPFVNTVQAPSGTSGLILTGPYGVTTTATSGPITLAVNVSGTSGGLKIENNVVKLSADSVNAGDGLRIDTITTDGTPIDNTVKFETCTNDQTWKYNAVSVPPKWECVGFPKTSSGQSVMYLKSKSEYFIYPTDCPAGWSTIPAGSSGAVYTFEEDVHDSGNSRTNWHNVRVCYRTDLSCQVTTLRKKNLADPPSGYPVCPTGWTSAGTADEYAPGATATNYVRTCYVCG